MVIVVTNKKKDVIASTLMKILTIEKGQTRQDCMTKTLAHYQMTRVKKTCVGIRPKRNSHKIMTKKCPKK